MTWTANELATLGDEQLLRISTTRSDGSTRRPVIIWAVVVGNDLYVRSVRGDVGGWYRHIQANPDARIESGGVKREVTTVAADRTLDQEIDDAYLAKYGPPFAVDSITIPAAKATTLKLVPRIWSS